MPFETFYQTVAQLCFTLLGLWWLVLQTKYREWIGNPLRRRMITNISLYFLLPGSMSLIALLSSQDHLLWQVAFFVASGIGCIEVLALIRSARTATSAWTVTALRWVGVVLYAVVALAAVVAFIPGAAAQLQVNPLEVSGVLITLLVVSGVLLAWLYFIEPGQVTALSTGVSSREQREV